MSKPTTALVVGGGIAGPVVALALRKAGIRARVVEAYPTPADGVGGSLAIAPNGIAALGIIGAAEPVLAVSRPISRQVLAVGRRHFVQPRLADAPPLRLLWRADLHRALHDHAVRNGVSIEHGKRLVDAEQGPSGVTAHFADGTREEADVLIGADGVHSTVRTVIDPDAPGPHYTGMLDFEAVVDREVPGPPDTLTFAFGKRGYYLYRPRPGGGAEWGANLPHKAMTLAEARAVSPEQWLRVLRDTYAKDEPGGALARATDPDRLHILGPIRIMPPVPRWHRGRMVLVGDAVHAPSNSTGQGASLAIESSVQLARCLRDQPDAPSAFAAYEGLRRARVERIAAAGARINSAKAPGPVARALMPLLIPVMFRTVMSPQRAQASIYRYRIDWDDPVASPATG
jgi:2-polyprenyl-6-methoxyphenol hydroxylase-like FAD-dependent oxidoreductase